ncbi:MAG: ABC transporter ATP-binding protein [Negativicutes bacterium]|nr:ABC transporter ATP-binding protein [Negativicutes bacterium]
MKIIKKFISYYQPYKVLFFADMFCALLISLIDLSFPQLLKFFNNNLFQQDSSIIINSLSLIAFAFVGMYLLRFCCQYFITSWGHIMGARMESDMRQDLFNHFQRLPFSYYDKNNTGEMMSKIVSDLFDISELAHHGPENIFISLLKIIGSFILLSMINNKLTLILFIITLIMIAFSYLQNRKMHKVFMDNRKKIATVNARVQDSLSGIRIVKSFANEEIEEAKFSDSNLEFLSSKESSYNMMGIYQAGNSFFQGLLYTAVIIAGGYLIASNSMQIADLAIYALYIGILISPIEVLINSTEQFQKGYASFKRFVDILDETPEILNSPNAIDLTTINGKIAFENVSFYYDKTNEVLNNVNLQIPAGKTIALVGPSGGGKTTLCSLIPRFYDVNSGQITIDDIDIKAVTLKSLRNAIGIVQQDVYMFAGTVLENISYGNPTATFEEIVAAAKKANIHDFIMSLAEGYNSHVGEHGVKLSGGQKQRLAIARVFLKNPPILILDEATSALDNESEQHIQKSLEELATNRTTIVIAHRLSTIKNADEIIVINDNGIQEQGTHEKLLTQNGLYAKYYNMQFENID